MLTRINLKHHYDVLIFDRRIPITVILIIYSLIYIAQKLFNQNNSVEFLEKERSEKN